MVRRSHAEASTVSADLGDLDHDISLKLAILTRARASDNNLATVAGLIEAVYQATFGAERSIPAAIEAAEAMALEVRKRRARELLGGEGQPA